MATSTAAPPGVVAAAARRARSVPQMPLGTVAVGTDTDTLKQFLRSRPVRGRCAEAAAEAEQHPKAAAYAAAHWAAAPNLTRTASAVSVYAVAAGTAAWAARSAQIIGTPRPVGQRSSYSPAPDEPLYKHLLRRLPRTSLALAVASKQISLETLVPRGALAGHSVCPPAMVAAIAPSLGPDMYGRAAAAANPAGPPAGINVCGDAVSHPPQRQRATRGAVRSVYAPLHAGQPQHA